MWYPCKKQIEKVEICLDTTLKLFLFRHHKANLKKLPSIVYDQQDQQLWSTLLGTGCTVHNFLQNTKLTHEPNTGPNCVEKVALLVAKVLETQFAQRTQRFWKLNLLKA